VSDNASLPLTATDELALVPAKWAQPPAETIAKLPKPTRRDADKGRCNECGGWHGLPAVHLDYMGHADVTLALLDVDPRWTLDPVCDDNGLPIISDVGGRLRMWAHLTVLGHTRMCVGTCPNTKGEPEKELLGDALRNGAMRFGIGTRLWSKAEGVDPGADPYTDNTDTEPPPPLSDEHTHRIDAARQLFRGLPAELRTAGHQWARGQGRTITAAALTDADWLESVENWIDEAMHNAEAPG
jgi:hypothetical protein